MTKPDTNTSAPAMKELTESQRELISTFGLAMVGLAQQYADNAIHVYKLADSAERALIDALSKLRAPVADERDRNATISEVVGLCNRIPGSTTWNAAEFMYDEMQRRAALASAPVAGKARAVVYPPDGTESPFTVINLGSGAVQMGPCLHDGRLGGLWFGKNGQGMGHEQILNRHAHQGETIAVVTFANVQGLDVMLGELLRCREQYFPDADAAPQASEAVLTDLLLEIEDYLLCVVQGSMSRNNSEALASELGDRLRAALSAQPGAQKGGCDE